MRAEARTEWNERSLRAIERAVERALERGVATPALVATVAECLYELGLQESAPESDLGLFGPRLFLGDARQLVQSALSIRAVDSALLEEG